MARTEIQVFWGGVGDEQYHARKNPEPKDLRDIQEPAAKIGLQGERHPEMPAQLAEH